ncbi:MAG: hypothetical protein AB2L24_24005 [Mangrovibacterium sp.]
MVQDTFLVQRTEEICGMINTGTSSAEQGTLLEFIFPNGHEGIVETATGYGLIEGHRPICTIRLDSVIYTEKS